MAQAEKGSSDHVFGDVAQLEIVAGGACDEFTDSVEPFNLTTVVDGGDMIDISSSKTASFSERVVRVGVAAGSSTIVPADTPPSGPTNVTLSVVSDGSLGVSWQAPALSGGKAVQKYKIEWASDYAISTGTLRSSSHVVNATLFVEPDYASPSSVRLQGGFSGFQYKIGEPRGGDYHNLNAGVRYWVRVSAFSAEGYGPASSTAPLSLVTAVRKPYVPDTFTVDVSALDVSDQLDIVYTRPVVNELGFPTHDGGDDIFAYRVEFDTEPGFETSNFGFFDLHTRNSVGNLDPCSSTTPCKHRLGSEIQEIIVYRGSGYMSSGQYKLYTDIASRTPCINHNADASTVA